LTMYARQRFLAETLPLKNSVSSVEMLFGSEITKFSKSASDANPHLNDAVG